MLRAFGSARLTGSRTRAIRVPPQKDADTSENYPEIGERLHRGGVPERGTESGEPDRLQDEREADETVTSDGQTGVVTPPVAGCPNEFEGETTDRDDSEGDLEDGPGRVDENHDADRAESDSGAKNAR